MRIVITALLRVHYIALSGFKYETTGKAPSELEVVRLADELLEHVECTGISDHLLAVGITVHPPAQLWVDVIETDYGPLQGSLGRRTHGRLSIKNELTLPDSRFG